MVINFVLRSVVIASLLAAVGGCASGNSAGIPTDVQGDNSRQLSPPLVQTDGRSVVVSGTVYRPDWSEIDSAGHVHVQLLDGRGTVVQKVNAEVAMKPGRPALRTAGPRTAHYTARMACPMPEGGKVRVQIAFDSHAPGEIQE